MPPAISPILPRRCRMPKQVAFALECWLRCDLFEFELWGGVVRYAYKQALGLQLPYSRQWAKNI